VSPRFKHRFERFEQFLVNLHVPHFASARARRQGPGLPGPFRKAPKQNHEGGLCVLV
jgi:hypothetical protein